MRDKRGRERECVYEGKHGTIHLFPMLSLSPSLSNAYVTSLPSFSSFLNPGGSGAPPPRPPPTSVTVARHIGSTDIQQDGRSVETKL